MIIYIYIYNVYVYICIEREIYREREIEREREYRMQNIISSAPAGGAAPGPTRPRSGSARSARTIAQIMLRNTMLYNIGHRSFRQFIDCMHIVYSYMSI